MCSPTRETDIPNDMCSSTRETHIPSDMCSLSGKHTFLVTIKCSPILEIHISSDMCYPTGKHISLMISVSLPGKQISLVICVPLPGKQISLVICRHIKFCKQNTAMLIILLCNTLTQQRKNSKRSGIVAIDSCFTIIVLNPSYYGYNPGLFWVLLVSCCCFAKIIFT